MNILLSLGHNASAITTDEDKIVRSGFEEERLNRIKSCSNFPQLAIDACLQHTETGPGYIYISHWFDDFNFWRNGFADKHWTPDAIKHLSQKYDLSIVSLTPQFTHHDAHAWAALAFYESHSAAVPDTGMYVAVADGFGNREEVFSLYRYSEKSDSLDLVHRIHGYEHSLGLIYQYATSYCGMKENQDEYKFLGYESHVSSILSPAEMEQFQHEAWLWADNIASATNTQPSENAVYIDVSRLAATRAELWATFDQPIFNICRKTKDQFSKQDLRKIIGYFVQCIIENFYSRIIADFDIVNIVVTGGLHYNVKLNNHILANITGEFCATPLAGDQGAAIGLMRYNENRVSGLNSLLWGQRDLSYDHEDGTQIQPGVYYFSNEENYVDFVAKRINEGLLVNTITGRMEFGPRALCNTSTLALPSEKNVMDINALNGRDTVMPMAPVIHEANAHEFFNPADMARVVGSLDFMILTLDYHSTLDIARFRGVAHPYPRFGQKSGYSGRPQIVRASSTQPIHKILGQVQSPALINTSLNVHGVPIVYSADDAIHDHAYNVKLAQEQGLPLPLLVIGNF